MLDFRTNLFILKHQDHKDFDRFLTVFTEDFGKRSIKLRSAYRPSSKLNSNMQPFSIINCDIVYGKNFDIVCNANIEFYYDTFLLDIRKNISYFFISEIIEKQMDFHFVDKDIYNLCINYFNIINTLKLDKSKDYFIDFNKEQELMKVLYNWFINFLKILGIRVEKNMFKIKDKKSFFHFIYYYIEKNLIIEKFFK